MLFRFLSLSVISLILVSCSTKQPNVRHHKASYKIDKNNFSSVYKDAIFSTIKNNKNLDAYLHEVIQNNNNLKALNLTKKSLALGVKITRANMYPSGSIEIKNNRLKKNLKSEISSLVNANMIMSWDLDIWGKLSDETTASKYDYIDVENRYLQERRILLLNATIDWVNYWYISQVHDNQIALLKTYTNLTEHYLEESRAGLRDRYFYLEARRTKELVQSALFDTDLNLVKIRQQLNVYRGCSPDAILMITAHKDSVPVTLKLENEVISLSQRYDIKSAFAHFKSLTFTEKASYKALLPQLNFSTSASKSVENISKLFSGQLLWELIGGVTQPIFHANQLLDMAKQKSIESEIAWWQYQETVLQAFLEVQSITQTDISLNKQLEHKNSFYHNLLSSQTISKQKAQEGIMEFADYLQEKANTLNEKSNLLTLKSLYIKNRLRLISALGLSLLPLQNKDNIYEN